MTGSLIVIAKRPVPGRVKTRLVPPLTHEQAAAVAGAALADTQDAVSMAPARRRLLAFEGDPEGWLRPGWEHVTQPQGELDVRLTAAFAAVGHGSALLVGMDTPQLRPHHLAAFDHLRFDACLGLAPDGGYWAIGFTDATLAGDAILGVPMSTDTTGEVQLQRLLDLGLRVQLLDDLVDVDTVDDARVVAASAPSTRFARALDDALVPMRQVG